MQGATPLVIFKYPNQEHRYMQDNDPNMYPILQECTWKNWWRTPAESPNLNPIENMWHELKEHLRAKVKPQNLDELVTGIKLFWGDAKCERYKTPS